MSRPHFHLYRCIGPVVWLLAFAGCAAPRPAPVASYDDDTRRLVQVASDVDHDGRVDHWIYLDGGRTLRAEIDADQDGRIERWEYFDDGSALSRVGTSSRNDGVEDTWAWAEQAPGERRMELARARDGAIDRREFYRSDALVRVEEDTNADGRVDTWQIFENERLREVRVDTGRRGRADRRLLYDADGQFLRLEADPDGDGEFVPVAPAPGADRS